MFDWENSIALHAMQGNRASSRGKGKSHGFSRVAAGTWVIFSSYDRDALSFFFFLFVVNFVIHWNKTAMGLHVFPIPIPPPTSPSVASILSYQA